MSFVYLQLWGTGTHPSCHLLHHIASLLPCHVNLAHVVLHTGRKDSRSNSNIILDQSAFDLIIQLHLHRDSLPGVDKVESYHAKHKH